MGNGATPDKAQHGATGKVILPEGWRMVVEEWSRVKDIDTIPVRHLSNPWQFPLPTGVGIAAEIVGRLVKDEPMVPVGFWELEPEPNGNGGEEPAVPDFDQTIGEFELWANDDSGVKFTGVITRQSEVVDNREGTCRLEVLSQGPITPLPEPEPRP